MKDDSGWDFPGCPVAKNPLFHCRGHRFNPWLGNEDPICVAKSKQTNKQGTTEKELFRKVLSKLGSPCGSVVKNPPEMQETQVRSLDREDPLEKGTAAHSSILAWGIPWTEEPGGLQSMGSQRVGHD